MKEQKWDWVTDDMFVGAVESLCDAMGVEQVLTIPGVYELVAEELNNDVLARLAEADDRCTNCGEKLDEEGQCPEDREGEHAERLLGEGPLCGAPGTAEYTVALPRDNGPEAAGREAAWRNGTPCVACLDRLTDHEERR